MVNNFAMESIPKDFIPKLLWVNFELEFFFIMVELNFQLRISQNQIDGNHFLFGRDYEFRFVTIEIKFSIIFGFQ
jgi:hypothetical protein